MSRIAKKPIIIPPDVKVSLEDGKVIVEGKNGRLEQSYKKEYVEIKVEGNLIYVNRLGDKNVFKALQGMYYRLIENMIKGVVEPFSKTLVIQGIGYKWELKGKKLVISVGYSKPVEFEIPAGVEIRVENPQTLVVRGIDKYLVGQVAANIRAIRPPEPYKGKGIRYLDEKVKLKEGKAAK